MSALSDLKPPADADAPTLLPPAGSDRTMPNRGAAPLSLAHLRPRAIAFPPSEHAGDLGRLGRYRLLKELGKGGMGAVFLGFDERLQRKVALKVMRPDTADDAEAKGRFLREARAVAQITHDHVIAVYEADEADGIPFIAMQYLQGYPLDQYLAKKGRPSFPQIVRIGREVAQGLAAAHRLGIVHRDVKPGNVWLEAPHGRVKLLDFGLARPKNRTDGELTEEGTVVGTPAYMAPEQARGEPLDHRADLFALGVLLYRLTTNRLPFDGSDVMAVLTALAVDEPAPVAALAPEAPPPLAALIHELLAKKPANRPQTADEVAARLHAMHDRPGASNQVVYVPIAVTALGVDNAFAELADAPTEVAERSRSMARRPEQPRWPVGLILAGVAAMAVGGVVIAKFVGKDAPPQEAKAEAPKAVEAPKPAEPKREPPLDLGPFPKLDPAWLKAVTALPPTDLFGPVNEELRRRNPNYDGKGLGWVADPIIGARTALEVRSDAISDLTPLLAFANLEGLVVIGEGKNPAPVWHLGPVRGLKKLRSLRLHNLPELRDLGPLRGLPLERLAVSRCPVESLEGLQGMRLEKLEIPYTPVRDLAPVAGMPLRELWVGAPGTPLDLTALATCPLEKFHIEYGLGMDLTPLKKCPLTSFSMVYVSQPDLSPLEGSGIEKFSGFDRVQFEPFLRTLPKLESVASYNAAPVGRDEYFQMCEDRRRLDDAFVAEKAKLPLADRVAAVKQYYADYNRGNKAVLEVEVEGGEVVGVTFPGSSAGNAVWNFSFLRVFPKLRTLDLSPFAYPPLFHTITDLPLEEVRVRNLADAVGNNLYVLPRMKALKAINGVPVDEIAKEWNFKPAR